MPRIVDKRESEVASPKIKLQSAESPSRPVSSVARGRRQQVVQAENLRGRENSVWSSSPPSSLLPPPPFLERRAAKAPLPVLSTCIHTYTRIDGGGGGGGGGNGIVYTHRRGGFDGGTALTLPAFNCVPERDPPRLDIRAGVMTRELERRKKENRERHVRYPRHASCTYVPRGRRSRNRDQNEFYRNSPRRVAKRCTNRSMMKNTV